jgi:hypothetical protein
MLDIRITLAERPDGTIRMTLNASGRATADERLTGLAIGNAARVCVEAAGKAEGEPGAARYDRELNLMTLPAIEIKPFI